MDITLNQTPIRTARNYQINDITLKNVKIPTDFSLKKSKISYNTVSAKDYILDIEEIEESEDEFEAEEINDEIANFMTKPLTYGNGEFADKQINEKCNFEKFVQINSIMSNEISFDFEIAKDAKNRVIKHFAFTDEKGLYDFIDAVLPELASLIKK